MAQQISLRQMRLDWVWLAIAGLLVQGFWAWRLVEPAYMDAYYYALNGRRLAQGFGFTEPIIWQFLDNPAGLPAPSHSYWMPLASLLAAAGFGLADSFRAAQLPFWLLAGTLPLLGYAIGRQLTGRRWAAVTAGLLTMVGGFYAADWNQPETFAPFAWAGGMCLLALARAMEDRRGWFVAGVLAGLAHLTRADGVLLLATGLIMWAWVMAPTLNRRAGNFRSGLLALGMLLAGYLLVMGGWFIRGWLVFGQPLSTAGAQTAFLTTYDDLYAYGRSFNLSGYLAWGWGNILRSKLAGVWLAVQSFVAVSGLVFLAPLMLLGWWKAREWRFVHPIAIYTVLLFSAMAMVFTFPGQRGGLYHSSVAIWPWGMALAVLGLDRAVDWAAGQLSHWQPERAKRVFAGLAVGLALATSLGVGLSQPAPEDPALYRTLGAMLPETAVVMVGDAPAFAYQTGLPAISVPNEPVEILLQVADRYGVTHLALDENHPRPLAGLYAGKDSSSRLRHELTIGEIQLRVVMPP